MELQAEIPESLSEKCGIPIECARKLVSQVHKRGGLPERAPATIRRLSLQRVKELGSLPTLEIRERLASSVDPFVKYALGLGGDRVIETVRIPLEKPGRFSVCVSSQVGCALACAFCATGRLGLRQNLEAWQIVEQVRIVRAELPALGRVHGVVFQGMGEPLANLERVIHTIRVLSEPSAQAIDRRNITVCTAGLPAGIAVLAREVPEVRLGVSLGDVRPGRRQRLMPIDERFPLQETLEATGEHTRISGHAPMFAYTLIAGETDDDDAVRALSATCRSFAERFGTRPRLSLIPYNEVDGPGFQRPTDDRIAAFRTLLRELGTSSILRYSGGGDVAAACGQLAPAQPAGKGLRLNVLPHVDG